MTVSEAAELLGLTHPGVTRAVERGKLSMIIDTEKPLYRGRTMLIRKEVEQWAKVRG